MGLGAKKDPSADAVGRACDGPAGDSGRGIDTDTGAGTSSSSSGFRHDDVARPTVGFSGDELVRNDVDTGRNLSRLIIRLDMVRRVTSRVDGDQFSMTDLCGCEVAALCAVQCTNFEAPRLWAVGEE